MSMSRLNLLCCLWLTACNCQHSTPVFLSAALMGKVEVLDSCNSSCDEGCESEILKQAIKEPGQGGIASGVLLRLTDDVPVYRLWNGPDAKLNAYGGTNRIGSWWSADKPAGNVTQYQRANAICQEWNDLAWEVKCTLKKGTVIAVGPTQSANCKIGDSFQANPTQQIYVDNVASRFVSCPKLESDNPADRDFPVDPNELLLQKKAQAVPLAEPAAPATGAEVKKSPSAKRRNHR